MLFRSEHYNFSSIIQFPAAVWRASPLIELTVELNRWIMVWGAFVFFAIFGFTEESRNNYRAMLQPVVQVFTKITGIKNRPSRKAELEGCVILFFFSVLRLICYLESRSTIRVVVDS